jgi:DNA primase large subunit
MSVGKMMRRVRDWIIKKMGGYTAAEYERIGRVPLQKAFVEQRNVEKLEVSCVISRASLAVRGLAREEVVRRELAVRLTRLVEERMTVQSREDVAIDSIVIRAYIRVVTE